MTLFPNLIDDCQLMAEREFAKALIEGRISITTTTIPIEVPILDIESATHVTVRKDRQDGRWWHVKCPQHGYLIGCTSHAAAITQAHWHARNRHHTREMTIKIVDDTNLAECDDVIADWEGSIDAMTWDASDQAGQHALDRWDGMARVDSYYEERRPETTSVRSECSTRPWPTRSSKSSEPRRRGATRNTTFSATSSQRPTQSRNKRTSADEANNEARRHHRVPAGTDRRGRAEILDHWLACVKQAAGNE